MSPFWGSLFDELRERGRNAALFIFAILIFLGLLLFAAQIPRDIYVNYVLPVLPVVGALILFGLVKGFFEMRARRRQRLNHGPLSADELKKARAKLATRRDQKAQ